MNHSGQELLGKINDLLEISSLCAGIDQINEKQVPLSDLVRSVIDTHTRELYFRHIQVEVDLPSVLLVGDRIKLQQALSHLLKNALKFSPDYSVISLRGHQREDGTLCLIMADQGRGFTDEQLVHFHQRKQQFSFLERNRKLLGFGLPLAEELIRLHDGIIVCRNGAEGGAEVILTLPANRIIAVRQEARPRMVATPRKKKASKPTKMAMAEAWLA
jgi:two-component system cell cycle sensor histidine kinase PleC